MIQATFFFFMYFLAAQPTDGSSSLEPWASYTNTSSPKLLVSGVCHSDKSDLDTHSTSCLTSTVIDSIYNFSLLDVWGVSALGTYQQHTGLRQTRIYSLTEVGRLTFLLEALG